jgi:hypothetical protein
MDQVAEVKGQAAAEPAAGGHSDIMGRIIGMLVFLLGVGMLVLVFKVGYDLFAQKPSSVLGLKFTGDPKKDPAAAQIGAHFGSMLFQLGYLFLMSIAGSLIAQKGINLYFSSLRGKTPA